MHTLHSLNDWQLSFSPTVAWSTWENRLGAKQEQRLRYGNNDTAPMRISNHTQFNSYENLHCSEEAKAKAALERHTPASKASIKKTFPSNPAFVQLNHWLWWNFGWSCLQKPMFEHRLLTQQIQHICHLLRAGAMGWPRLVKRAAADQLQSRSPMLNQRLPVTRWRACLSPHTTSQEWSSHMWCAKALQEQKNDNK